MDAATQEDLVKIKDAILKELKDVEAIYLFGSVAKAPRTKKAITTSQYSLKNNRPTSLTF